MDTNSSVENVVVIGGGPAGLSAATYLARANLKPLVLAGSPPGGQLMLTSEVENYPGYESILGPDLIEKYRSQARRFETKVEDRNVIKVDFSQSPFLINTSEVSIEAKSLIIATGAKALWLNLSNEQRLRGKGVSACAICDGFFFKGKTVAVVGGGDTAMEEALTLTRFASKVYIIHRRNEFRASKIMQNRVLKHPKIEIIWNSVVEDVLGEQKVESIKVKTSSFAKASEDKQNLKVDGLFLAIGHKPDTDIFKGQIELDEKGYILTTARLAMDNLLGKRSLTQEKLARFKKGLHYNYSTSVPGVFAAGDCVDYQYHQAGTAVGMGIAAALEVEKWLEIDRV